MNSFSPRVSVVIPTHNRVGMLHRTLSALSRQSYPLDRLDVVVVADGCTDGTASTIRGVPTPFAITVVEQAGQGPAAARNNGAFRAQGDLLIFLDDDITPVAGFVEAHVAAHQSRREPSVVIGYSAPRLHSQRGFFRAALRGWWEAMFERMAEPGHRFSYSDLLSGNFSILNDTFNNVAGFDAAFRVHEDYELGARLMRTGTRFTYCHEARGDHHEETDLKRALRRKFDEGKADVQLVRKHPDLLPVLPLLRFSRSTSHRHVTRAAVAHVTPLGDAVTGAYRAFLPLAELMGMHARWRNAVDAQLGYWYWRGVHAGAGSIKAVHRLIEQAAKASAPRELELEVDLALGIAHTESLLDERRPSSVFLHYRGVHIGQIPAVAGSERLRGAHLRPLLRESGSTPLLPLFLSEHRWRSPTCIDPIYPARGRVEVSLTSPSAR